MSTLDKLFEKALTGNFFRPMLMPWVVIAHGRVLYAPGGEGYLRYIPAGGQGPASFQGMAMFPSGPSGLSGVVITLTQTPPNIAIEALGSPPSAPFPPVDGNYTASAGEPPPPVKGVYYVFGSFKNDVHVILTLDTPPAWS